MTALLLALLLGVVACSDGTPPGCDIGEAYEIVDGEMRCVPAPEVSYDDLLFDLTDISMSDVSSAIEFWSENTWLFRIKEDGTVEVNPEIDLDEASREFFDYLGETFREFCKCPGDITTRPHTKDDQ